MDIHDLIIIGAGPAGITASVYAARKQLDFLVISRDIGGQVINSLPARNWPRNSKSICLNMAPRLRKMKRCWNWRKPGSFLT